MTKYRSVSLRAAGALAAVLAGGTALLSLARPGTAAPAPVVFSKQVLPMLNRECLSCHKGSAAPGGYSLESQEKLFAGGRHGRAVVPGKSKESTLVKYLTGELKPQMPPGKPLDLETIALVRRWIDEGAKVDSMVAPVEKGGIMRGAMPMQRRPGGAAVPTGHQRFLPAAVIQSAPVTALAYSPDGTRLAVGGYRAVRLLDPATGEVKETLTGAADQVLSLAWSSDSARLAAAGGSPGTSGEVCVWSVKTPAAKPRVLRDHTDTINAVAWRPGTEELATAGQDRTARLWDLGTGKVTRILKDHVAPVTGVAYSADGKWLATSSLDRTARLYEAGTSKLPTTLTHGEGVSGVAFSPRGDVLVTCAEKRVRVWPVKSEGNRNPLREHGEGEPVCSITFSADGSRFAWGATNRRVRLWNAEVSDHKRELQDAQDWVYSVALSPDGKTAAAGAGDGKVYFWNAEDGKLLRSLAIGPAASQVAATSEAAK
ncbi:MAG: c-type cytochrome domain-containing protein [Armatimonadota bacterium]